ncbi:MAG TPA: HhH-GPD-type base excision DNA repair protein [Acidimicrobiales bacterium]|nr:HhH-GPD-type base excision DNA repair protein [Acidimicrobiales bacterium]
MATLHLSQDAEADKLLSDDPLALLIGMVLDQQVALEWAFIGPRTLKDRLGHLDARKIADMDPEALVHVALQKPPIHRYPAAMARRVHELCQLIAEEYDGDAATVWSGATDGADLYKRIKALPGFGEMKAKIFVALVGKQLGVRPSGWEAAAGEYGRKGTYMSVADIVDGPSLDKVRAYKQEKKKAAKAAAQAPA